MLASRVCISCRLLRPNHHRIVSQCYVSGAKSEAVKPSDKKQPPKIDEDIIPRSEIDPVSGLPFRKLELIPSKQKDDSFMEEMVRPYDRVIPPPRANRMTTDQDWPSVWPTAHSFKASTVPLPIRMGFQQSLKTPPPAKKGNMELMKIPNFFHLTPPAIKRHCEAIKKFCTPWPKELTADEKGEALRRQHYPIEIHTCDYVHSGPSIRDARSRIVTLQVKVADLPLGDTDSRARQKFIKLLGERYDKATDMLTIVTDRCPIRHQNRDYAMYLLGVLFHESWKEEPWENEITTQDQHKWFWNGSKSEEAVVDLVKRFKAAYELAKPKDQATASETMKAAKTAAASFPEYIRHAKKEISKEDVAKMGPVKRYALSWEQYRNSTETIDNVDAYGESVRALLGLPPPLKVDCY